MAVAFNPMQTLSGSNSFQLQSQGYIQGAFMDDPVSRMWLRSGIVSASLSQPLWGGLPIVESVPSEGNNLQTKQGVITLATTAAEITGWTVFNRAHSMLITPGNPVPQADSGMSIAYLRNNSNIRIPVKVDPALVSTLEGGSVIQQVSWDFTNNQLIAFATTALNVLIEDINANSKIVEYNSSTNTLTWSYGPAALIQIL